MYHNKFKEKMFSDNHIRKPGSSVARKLNFSKSMRNSSLSQETREKVLQIKKINDPFHPELQGAFTEFVHHVGHLEEEDVDLPEVTLLLRGAAKIYTSQVDSLVKDIDELLECCTRTKKASIERKKPRKSDQPTEGDETSSKKQNDDDKFPSDKKEDDNGKPSVLESEASEEKTGEEKSPEMDNSCPIADVQTEAGPGELALEKTIETIILDGENLVLPSLAENLAPETNGGILEDGGASGPVDGDCLSLRSTIIGDDINTQNGSQDLGENIKPLKKKLKNGVSLPPILISCYEEWDKLVLSGVFDDYHENHFLPPSLDKAIRASKRKLYVEDKITLAKKAKEDICEDSSSKTDGNGAMDSNDKDLLGMQMEPVDIKPDISSGFSLSQEFPSAAAASFSPEDQAVIQECINDLHYLPFTFGLSKTDLSSAFSKTVDKMSQVFKKNNVSVTKHMVKEASVIAKTKEKSEKSNGLIHPVAHNLGDIYNTFVKMCRQECETFITNTSVSIMERSKEKSFAESRANIRSMIAELQRNIVPKFARVPLMAENTPEFFQHVTNFEKKMKKILEEEARKDEFDVRKYERDVLEVTAKESTELDRSDDFVVPNSPLKLPCLDIDNFDRILTSPSTRSSFDGSQSSCGSSWVPLKHIFHHMKSFDRTETARSFYAVLALLSYQNLDINYDQLYSKESAALIRKQLLGGSIEEELDSKFPRGAKICTSRCPDADKEEVFVAALTSESRDEAFRHFLAQETRNIAIRDGAPTSSKEFLLNESRIDAGIAEAMADFVEENSTVFKGRLHAKRRKKNSES